MTGDEWASSKNPKAMLTSASALITARQARFIRLAFCEEARSLMIDERVLRGLVFIEKFVESGLKGRRGRRELQNEVKAAAQKAYGGTEVSRGDRERTRNHVQNMLAWMIHCALGADVGGLIRTAELSARSIGWTWGMAQLPENVPDKTRREFWGKGIELAEQVQADRLREIVGNPFCPIIFFPLWRTSDVISLAQGIHDEHAFDRMPILADALQDAGCDNANILIHCRDVQNMHVRGCWVIDLILGKS